MLEISKEYENMVNRIKNYKVNNEDLGDIVKDIRDKTMLGLIDEDDANDLLLLLDNYQSNIFDGIEVECVKESIDISFDEAPNISSDYKLNDDVLDTSLIPPTDSFYQNINTSRSSKNNKHSDGANGMDDFWNFE